MFEKFRVTPGGASRGATRNVQPAWNGENTVGMRFGCFVDSVSNTDSPLSATPGNWIIGVSWVSAGGTGDCTNYHMRQAIRAD